MSTPITLKQFFTEEYRTNRAISVELTAYVVHIYRDGLYVRTFEKSLTECGAAGFVKTFQEICDPHETAVCIPVRFSTDPPGIEYRQLVGAVAKHAAERGLPS